MAVQPRQAWFQPVARQAAPIPVPAAPSAPAPQPPIVPPALPSQAQKPNPPPPLAAASPPSTDAPPPSSPALAAAPPRSPVAPLTQALPTPKSLVARPAPAPSTPKSPFAPQPLVNVSPSASKSPTIPKPIATAIRNGLIPGQAATPASSPKIAKPLETTQVQSLKTKPVSRPLSPLTLPPVQIKTESAHENKKDKVANKKLSDSGEGGLSVITLAGENEGAIMEFSPSPKIDYSAGNPHSLHETISIKDGSDGEQSSIARSELARYKDKFNKAKAMQSTPMTAIINSNFQGVNNAILHDCTFTHHDPGNDTGGSGNH